MKPRRVLVILLFALVGFAQAQFPMGNFDPTKMLYEPITLLQKEEVRGELKLDKDQSKKLDAVLKAQQQKMMDLAKMAQGGGANMDLNAAMQMMTELQKATDEGNKEATAILKPEQAQRLKELRVQYGGAKLLLEPEIAKELELTPDQTAKLESIKAEEPQKMMALITGGNRGPGMQKEIVKIQDQTKADMLAVLTKDQADKFTAMEGKPFPPAKKKS